jgi:hypothetical protein
MRQGRSTRDVKESSKTEPVSKAVSPSYVGDIGIQQVRTSSVPMYEGRGLKAPMKSIATHKAGSQGKR